MAKKGKSKAVQSDRSAQVLEAESARIRRTFRTSEHMSYPDANGRQSPLAEELSRHLRPNIREAVLKPPARKSKA